MKKIDSGSKYNETGLKYNEIGSEQLDFRFSKYCIFVVYKILTEKIRESDPEHVYFLKVSSKKVKSKKKGGPPP